ncbi:LON peptidase substrate-binding domain-containing protein [Sphingomonas sp. BIUV-7]|uniref:LON peptidase substrate-binding domain-containing protein n=1 Tax=Sphingomonas natans TaxID=3063330 RepID=A0ABT8Y563_9SPHN|nr:LON peptidase substrate-binding domain-containing protein [Sphingomonas sp. BIUV-7]MDO6413053.1 LON peptidase substrate-binding domain-containing protein [Sphingomonas sp. BIUV-7]
MTTRTGTRLTIFPLPGALLLPRAFLPLHIFEPRYRAMVSDALARDRRIAMIQPLPTATESEAPALFEIGCVGRIAQVEAVPDGRFNLVLEGVTRFRLLREMDVSTPFRQIEADLVAFEGDADDPEPLPSVIRAEVEIEARRFAETQGFDIEWEEVGRLDDEALVSGISQVVPFDVASKQALLEASSLVERADMLVEFLRFFGLDAGEAPTLQ